VSFLQFVTDICVNVGARVFSLILVFLKVKMYKIVPYNVSRI